MSPDLEWFVSGDHMCSVSDEIMELFQGLSTLGQDAGVLGTFLANRFLRPGVGRACCSFLMC